jgi:hypothetical protein
MSFIMHMDEQILLLFEGAMEVHCNRKKEQKMPFRCFKKIIELNLNSFLTMKRKSHEESIAYGSPCAVGCDGC